MSERKWLEVIKAKGHGSVRVPHCAADDSAVASWGPRSWRLYCHRCGGVVDYEPYPTPTLSELAAEFSKQQQAEREVERSIVPPLPINTDVYSWPAPRRAWLYKAGLTNERIMELGIYFCDKLDRVVLPIAEGDKLVYWQARGFDTRKAKYLNPSIPAPLVSYGKGEVVVLVEDYLSAVRVSDVTECWPLLGTSLSDAGLARILSEPRKIVTWFDPDPAGISKSAKLRLQLRGYGKDVGNIKSRRDPKFLSRAEILSHIQEVSCSVPLS